MKKRVLILVVLSIFGMINLFAAPEFKMSLGLGGLIRNDFGGGVESSFNETVVGHYTTPNFGGGGLIYLDMTFIEFSMGLFGLGGEWEDYGAGIGTNNIDFSGFGWNMGIYGKYPFFINKKFSVAPLLGMTFDFMTSVKIDEKKINSQEGASDLSTIWFRGGSDLDFYLTEKIYLRTKLLYGVRIGNKFESDMIKYLDELSGGVVDTKQLLGHGYEIMLAIGIVQ